MPHPPHNSVTGGAGSSDVARMPGALRALLVVLIVEAVALGMGAAAIGFELVSGRSDGVGVSLFLVVFALGVALILLLCARGLRRGRRGARAPVATWQILQGVVAANSLTVAMTVLPMVAIVLAVAALVLLVLPTVVAATVGSR